ncbi:hypothetical protein [Actinacidiphila sp. ITFR-21]|uniref:hypothetical protein n=1 Tax=Actinacidiphila sp. ITFR-21 TaxID=3075199 RepID=UPI00288ABB6D|nr:hypothetical protein [Streptomyces sp. ITFR-21]WNI19919.1 hypothetical protein RLT57_30715 [Streptomyces sp. ITFR-21]
MQVTVQQIKDLWAHGGRIDRGDDYSPVTTDDLSALDIDTDDDGVPLDSEWQVIADQINSEVSAEAAPGSGHELLLQGVEDAARAIDDAVEERDGRIRHAVASRVPVAAIARAAGLTCKRIYQIRDNRR